MRMSPKEKTKDRDESRNRFRPSVYQKKRSAKNPGLFEGKICVFNPGFLAEPAKEARKALIELVLPTHLTETGLTEATDRAQLSGALDVAGAGWAKPRPFNGHSFHRIPAPPPSKLDQQLPLASSHCHHLRHSPAHPRARMIRLLEDGRLDLF